MRGARKNKQNNLISNEVFFIFNGILKNKEKDDSIARRIFR